jgi:signal transduction histidine kinase/DNA-binding response OmpR family regulator
MNLETENVKVLVVDDLPEKRLVLQVILNDLGSDVETVTASTGDEALQKLLEHEFAVILLDVNMPGMDGLETASYIRRRKKSAHTPIIFVTAYADELLASQGYSLGAVDYILSPVVPEILRTKVAVFVDLFRKTQQVQRQAEERVILAREQSARVAAEAATRRSNFLAEATKALSGSLELESTMKALARVAVGGLADASAITFVDPAEVLGDTHFFCGPESSLLEFTADQAQRAGPFAELLCQAAASGEIVYAEDVGQWPTDCLGDSARWRESADAAHNRAKMGHWPLKSVTVAPLSAGGKLVGLLTLAARRRTDESDRALIEDLTARAAMALDNARLYQDMRTANRRKDEFLAMLAHELRNPLAPIRNAAQILRVVGMDDPVLNQARDTIDRQVSHMVRLIDDLVDVSRLARGKVVLRMETLDLVQLVRATADDFRGLVEQSGLTLEVKLPSKPVCVTGDPARISQMLANLLHNAHKFSDPGGRINVELTANAQAGMAAIVIRDQGIGMEPEILASAFEPFSQADRSLDRSRGGLGLGLALVKGLAEMHGGNVTATSSGLGCGVQMKIHLPLVAGASAPLAAASDEQLLVTAPLRILIIEDNRDAAESLKTLLRLIGHEAEVAYDGAAGVKLAAEFQPDAVLCDIGLPGEFDGYRVALSLRQDAQFASTYLVATTGYDREEDRSQSRRAGFNAHLTKPVSLTDLQRLLSEVSAIPQTRAATYRDSGITDSCRR